MKYNYSISRLTVMISIASMLIFLVSCSGGGGGDTPTITYTGKTTPAEITQSNAGTLAFNSVNVAANGTAFSGILGTENTGEVNYQPDQPSMMDVVRAMEDAMYQIDFISDSGQFMPEAVEQATETIPGGCGGNATISVQVNTDTGAFSGSLTFNGFNDCDDVVLTGRTTFSGVINISTEELEWFTFNFQYITGTSGSESISMSGTIEIDLDVSSISYTMDMRIRNNNTSKVYKIENYQMDITDMGTYAQISVSGRFYDSVYGCVDVTTTPTLPILIYDYNDYPHSGQIVITGKIGTEGGPTQARLTAISEIYCQVEADTNGDGAWDYDSGQIPWSSL